MSSQAFVIPLLLATSLAFAGPLTYKPTPRPWGDSYLPRSKAPAKRLLVVDADKLNKDERSALASLQGLTSRTKPCIWINRNDQDRFWLDWHRKKGHVEGVEVVKDWTTLFKRFKGSYKGAVLYDPNLYRGELLAVNVAGCEDLIVATPELAEKLGLEVKLDLRGRFSKYVDGMQWVWDTYKDKLNHSLCNFMHPSLMGTCVFAFQVQWRGITLWPVGPVDAKENGTDMAAERKLTETIFAQMAPNTPVMGFPYCGEGVGPGEVGGVELASRYGIGLVCTDFMGNTCITSGYRVKSLKQPKQPAAPKLEKGKVYIALVMSDGDNENTWVDFFKRYFENPAFGKVPLAFGMGPAILELQPAVAEWYYDHATPTTEFIADVSGVSYMQPDKYGQAYSDPGAVLDGFLDWTARTMKPLGMRSFRSVGGEDNFLTPYAKKLSFCHSILADMGRYSGHEGIANLTYSLPDGMPVFRSVTSWRYGKEGFLREVREQVGAQRPAFVNGFVHCWTYGMDDIARFVSQKDADMVFVTPAQLAGLYKQARARGWAR